MFVFLRGNISDGFEAYGPYLDFDDACGVNEGEEGWVMSLTPSEKTFVAWVPVEKGSQ